MHGTSVYMTVSQIGNNQNQKGHDMKLSFVIGMSLVLLICCPVLGSSLDDPYDILGKHYEAMGGLDKHKAQISSHIEGTIVIDGTGLEGTFAEWRQKPNLSRQDVDLGVIKQLTGDNGEYSWSVDHNGKLQLHQDEITLKERQLALLVSDYEFLNRDSEHFTLTFEGIDTAVGSDCYIVRTENNITPDITTEYYDTTSLLLIKSVTVTLNGESHTVTSDYREVDGIMMPYSTVTTMFPTGMIQRAIITAIETNIEIDPGLFEPPDDGAEDFRFANGKSLEDLPFDFIDNHIYLQVTVGGRTRLWVLDSGAGVTCLDKMFAKELGLTEEATMTGQGAGNLVEIAWVSMPAFDLGGLEFDEQKAATLDLNSIFDRWVGFEVVGILGYDFLSRVVTKIDYANQTLSFYHPDSFQYVGDGTIIDAPLSQEHFFHLPLSVDGEHDGLWNLDLGAGGMSFHYPHAKSNGLLDRPGIDGLGHGAGGSSPRRISQFGSIEFAGFSVPDPIISMAAEEGQGAFASGELIGNIGNTLLRHFTLYLDYQREQVIVEKGGDFDKVFPHDNSGLQVANDDGQIVINFVAGGTPGATAGFETGDVIRTVNGLDVGLMEGVVAFKELLRSDPGTEFEVAITRGDTTKQLKLTLADLY
jgi:hypothetical protein